MKSFKDLKIGDTTYITSSMLNLYTHTVTNITKGNKGFIWITLDNKQRYEVKENDYCRDTWGGTMYIDKSEAIKALARTINNTIRLIEKGLDNIKKLSNENI